MNIILIGFMGAGKTTVGRKLANRLGYFFLDTDQQIEKQQGCTIEEIFRYAGEATFRFGNQTFGNSPKYTQHDSFNRWGDVSPPTESRITERHW